MTAFETYLGESTAAVSLVDHFAQVRGTRGLMPAPIPPVRFRLVEVEVQNVMTPIEPPIELKPQSGPSGAYVFANEGRVGKEPWTRIAEGRYRLRVESDYYQPLSPLIDWPLQPGALGVQQLRPGYNYPYPDVTLPSERITLLRGTVIRGVGGAPVENATVEITAPPNLGDFVSATTDANGAWALAFRHANANPIAATVTIAIPGEAPFDVTDVTIAPGADNSLSQTALRGTVLTTAGRPIRGAEITVDLVANESVFSDRDGQWRFYFGLNFGLNQPPAAAQVTAVAPNGQSQSTNVNVINRATVVVPAFRIG